MTGYDVLNPLAEEVIKINVYLFRLSLHLLFRDRNSRINGADTPIFVDISNHQFLYLINSGHIYQ